MRMVRTDVPEPTFLPGKQMPSSAGPKNGTGPSIRSPSRRLVERALANHLDRDDDRSPSLPVALVDPPDVLAKLAEGAVTLQRLREFVGLLGTGRTLTPTGRLRLSDAAELIAHLGLSDVINPKIGDRTFTTTSSADLRNLTLLFELARKTGVARVLKGRLVPVKSAAKTLKDLLALAQRSFDALLDLGEVVFPQRPFESLLTWELHDVALTLLTAMHVAPCLLDRDEIDEIVLGCIDDDLPFSLALTSEMWTRRSFSETAMLLSALADLGIVNLDNADQDNADQDHAEVTLTGLGTALLIEHLRADGFIIPAIDDLLGRPQRSWWLTPPGSPRSTGTKS